MSWDRNQAVKTLTYYVQRSWEASGLKWEADNAVEMESLVDFIIDAAAKKLLEDLESMEHRR